jgi:lysozyme
VNVDKIRKLLALHEGRKAKMYKDSKGIHTIGIGHNLRDKPISERAIDVIFEDDLNEHANELFQNHPWAAAMDEVRQGALIDFYFNVGGSVFAQFKNTVAAMKVGNWEAAALGLERSDWYTQVGTRGPRIVKMFRDGKWPV